MILHASKTFTKRLKCKVSSPNGRLPHHTSLDSWSIDLFELPKVGAYAVAMNDASLSTLIIPLHPCKNHRIDRPSIFIYH